MNQFILALCGLPAAGKSALADAIQKALNFKVEIVRTDDWRDDEYYSNWKPEKEGPVRLAALEKVKEVVEDGKSVIHDDTNYYTSMRHELFEIALENKCGFAIIHVTTPLTTALQWNRERTDTKIHDGVIEAISERFDKPGSRYLWDNSELEVDMERQDPTTAVPKVLKILESLEPAMKPKPRLISNTEFDSLDTATRQTVAEFLKDHPELRGHREVSVIRRSLLSRASERRIPVKEVHDMLWAELLELV